MPGFKGIPFYETLCTLLSASITQQAEGSGDEEEGMEGVESESIMTHVNVPSQQEVSGSHDSPPHPMRIMGTFGRIEKCKENNGQKN